MGMVFAGFLSILTDLSIVELIKSMHQRTDPSDWLKEIYYNIETRILSAPLEKQTSIGNTFLIFILFSRGVLAGKNVGILWVHRLKKLFRPLHQYSLFLILL